MIRSNTFKNWIKIGLGDEAVDFVRSLLMKFDLIMPLEKVSSGAEGKVKYLVPLLFENEKRDAIPLIHNEKLYEEYQLANETSPKRPFIIETTYKLPFKPPAIFKRVFLRLRQCF